MDKYKFRSDCNHLRGSRGPLKRPAPRSADLIGEDTWRASSLDGRYCPGRYVNGVLIDFSLVLSVGWGVSGRTC
ncbi:hypothetical protein GWI33_010208 [Rhynchophorus ferrugineus]|uniref:Uncharacterized protein n=1 Tax=Rhynchophorus ferrugineus TaxID=354439 RepID=A0A834IXJ5_RHYFE|nr:hypothetical protein GWI33_010208 [Rhynchophorus ferrugineus]